MKLVKNWKRICLRSHSMWANYLGVAVLVAPEGLYVALEYDVASPRLWWALGVALIVYGMVGRLKSQGISE